MPETIARRLKNLRKVWREQNFVFTPEQKQAYEVLTKQRHEQIREWVKNGEVWSGPAKVVEPAVIEED